MASGRDAAPDRAVLRCHVDVADRGSHADERFALLREPRRSRAVHTASGEAESEVCSVLVEWHSVANLVVGVARRRLAHREVELVIHAPHLPPLRNPPQLRVLEGIREEVGQRLGEAGLPASGLGADGVEVHEPRLEDRPRDGLQRFVHAAVQFDLVVERAEDVGDGTLFLKRRERDFSITNVFG